MSSLHRKHFPLSRSTIEVDGRDPERAASTRRNGRARCGATLLALAAALSLTLDPMAIAAGGASIDLPSVPSAAPGSTDKALATRRSVRHFSSRPVKVGDLARLLWAAQGVTSPDGHRSAPSAGALYPLELIVVAARVDGLEPGLYRYVPAGNRLNRLAGGADLAGFVRAAHDQEWIGEAPVVVVFAAVPARTAAKYGARSERYVAIEVGAAAENLALEAVGLGLGTTFVGAFDDAKVARLASLERGEQPYLLVPAGFP